MEKQPSTKLEIHEYMHAYMYVYIYVCIHIHMNVCIYVYSEIMPTFISLCLREEFPIVTKMIKLVYIITL